MDWIIDEDGLYLNGVGSTQDWQWIAIGYGLEDWQWVDIGLAE